MPDFIEVRDERFARLIHGNARIDKLWTGGRWTEGAAYLPAGKYLIWSDIPNDRLMRWDETSGHVSVFEHPCRNQNGHAVDAIGRLVACEHRGRAVSRIEPDGARTVLADRYAGKRLNSPNDVVVKSDGSIWFTDPTYGIDSDYEGDAAASELGASHVFRIDPADGASGVFRDDPVVAVLSHPADAASLTAETFRVADETGTIAGVLRLSPDARVVVWTPSVPLRADADHVVSIAGLRDLRGREMTAHKSGFRACRFTARDTMA